MNPPVPFLPRSGFSTTVTSAFVFYAYDRNRSLAAFSHWLKFIFLSLIGSWFRSFHKLQHLTMDHNYYMASDENSFKNDTFDDLLAAGYYRMQHMMFTCNDTSLGEEGPPIPVFWLRTLVKECKFDKSANMILKKCSGFTITVEEAYVDEEIESMYRLYKNHVPFSVSSSCFDYLHQEMLPQPFDSMMIKVRNGEELIATGFFDKGTQSIAGIMNIYHPAYQKYSLGKLLILKKLQYSLLENKRFYYTGYISTGSTRFDYKTFPDPTAVEVLLPDKQQWLPYHLLSKAFLEEYYLKYLA
jgi:arginine-tRNA-protein transferase